MAIAASSRSTACALARSFFDVENAITSMSMASTRSSACGHDGFHRSQLDDWIDISMRADPRHAMRDRCTHESGGAVSDVVDGK